MHIGNAPHRVGVLFLLEPTVVSVFHGGIRVQERCVYGERGLNFVSRGREEDTLHIPLTLGLESGWMVLSSSRLAVPEDRCSVLVPAGRSLVPG